MNRPVFQLIIALGISLCGLVWANEKIWVISESAKLKTDQSISSTTIALLPKGTELIVISVHRKWYCVVAPTGEYGWVFRNNISNNPLDVFESNNLHDLLGESPDSEIEVKTANTERSIRGQVQEKSLTGDQQKEDSLEIPSKQLNQVEKEVEDLKRSYIEFQNYNNSELEVFRLSETLLVVCENVELKAEIGQAADTITVLEYGTELTVIAQQGMWYQVKTSAGENGWIKQEEVMKVPAGKREPD